MQCGGVTQMWERAMRAPRRQRVCVERENSAKMVGESGGIEQRLR